LKKDINHFTILINRSPKVMLLTLNLHEYFVNEERVAVASVLPSQSLSVLRPELVAP